MIQLSKEDDYVLELSILSDKELSPIGTTSLLLCNTFPNNGKVEFKNLGVSIDARDNQQLSKFAATNCSLQEMVSQLRVKNFRLTRQL